MTQAAAAITTTMTSTSFTTPSRDVSTHWTAVMAPKTVSPPITTMAGKGSRFRAGDPPVRSIATVQRLDRGVRAWAAVQLRAPDRHQGIRDIEEGVAPLTVPISSFLQGVAGRFVVGAAQANHELSESFVHYRSGINCHSNLVGVGVGIQLHRRVRQVTEPPVGGYLACFQRCPSAVRANAGDLYSDRVGRD